MKAYDVILDGETINTVFWVDNSDADEVRRSLINHDGYDPGIKVSDKAGFTPGPWRSVWGHVDPSDVDIRGPKRPDGSSPYIATLSNCNERDENARLIAAAPEMYEALKGLFEHCAMIHKHWGEGSNAQEADIAIKFAQAALRRAEGK